MEWRCNYMKLHLFRLLLNTSHLNKLLLGHVEVNYLYIIMWVAIRQYWDNIANWSSISTGGAGNVCDKLTTVRQNSLTFKLAPCSVTVQCQELSLLTDSLWSLVRRVVHCFHCTSPLDSLEERHYPGKRLKCFAGSTPLGSNKVDLLPLMSVEVVAMEHDGELW